jgi:hypothetical protein
VTRKVFVLLALAVVVGAVAWSGLSRLAGLRSWSKTGSEVRSSLGTEILVMRTPGGLLEVSTIRATEQFDKKFVYSVLGMKVGETIPHIRVPAVYRYHIELAREWKILRTDELFTVVAPAVQPTLPVAIDLAHMEKDVGGTWVLLPFNSAEDLDVLEREIGAKLAEKASSPVYLQVQGEAARKTVTEFVRKWLVTQEPWQSAAQPRIEVIFAGQ